MQPVREAIPTLRELEAKVAENKAIAQAKQRQKAGFMVRFMRELGLAKEPATCVAYTRQAVPCRRPAIQGKFCRLHAPAVATKKSFWQRSLGLSVQR